MCTEGMARAFRGSYPGIGVLTTAACMYAVATSPPLHAEVFFVTARPVNGTLRAVHCNAHLQVDCPEARARVVGLPSCAG